MTSREWLIVFIEFVPVFVSLNRRYPNHRQPQYIDHAESKNEITARILTDQIPKARIYTELAATQVTDNNDPDTDIDFATRSEDRGTETEMDMLISADLIQLPKSQAFTLLECGQLYKLRLPLPGSDPLLPKDIEEISRERLAHYGADHA